MNPDSAEAILFRELFSACESKLLLYADSLIGDRESARDIVQESFMKLTKALRQRKPQSEGETPPAEVERRRRWKAWLFTVTRNGALDYLRKRKPLIQEDVLMSLPSACPTPRKTLEQAELVTRMLQCLDRLTRSQREAIRLRFQNDLSYKEIAQVMNVSATNVGFLLHMGLKKLRELLKDELQAVPFGYDGENR
ncbi:RNA polymerase sigma factor [Methylacidimicrobium tartarophylax]|uniref:ECF RNA polymerase sigma factor SigM n=1 Tax=Methylacidimicrobium tartarophylax TaxID=1041768 RepID=A0A5E6M8B7_9BACT|nr:sigma-70 family RNA polymerase sigma factor [Methylacidimicrobium tartarophylax]VVM04641.1 ECF RNA polymerase sigma factor SigM [Methylacidimicrobium tartarophylax]